MAACNVEPADSDVATSSGSDNSFADRAKQYQTLRKKNGRQGSTSEILGFKNFNNDWQDCNTYVVALLKVEAWIHGRILECVWWQVDTHSRSRILNKRDDSKAIDAHRHLFKTLNLPASIFHLSSITSIRVASEELVREFAKTNLIINLRSHL